MKSRFISIILTGMFCIFAILAAGCTDSSNPTAGTGTHKIYISGAFALYPMMIEWSEQYKTLHPEVTFEISAGGAGKGMTDALSGMVDLGMVSRDIYPEEIEKGAVYVAVAKDAVVGTLNSYNPYLPEIQRKGISKETLKEIYIEKRITSWNQLSEKTGADAINIYTRSDACGAAEMWAKYLGYNQEDLNGIGIYSDPGLADAVKNDRLGIGYNNIGYAYDSTSGKPLDGLAIIPLDLNGNGLIDEDENFYSTKVEIMHAIADGRYPSPPARELNLVTRGEFKGTTRDFVHWILTDGQKYVPEAGYVGLGDERIQSQIQILNK